MTKVNGNNNVSAESQIVNGKKVKKQEQPKNQKQVFNNQGQKTPQKPNDSAIKQEVYKKSGYQLKDTKDRNKIIQLKVNGKIRSYKTVGTLTTGGRILVQDEKGAYHVVSHTKDNKLVMLKDDYAKNKIFYESTSSEHKVKYGKKNYVITNSKRDRHGRMSAIDENGKRVVLSSDGKELKTGYVEAEDQKDNMNDYIARATKGKSKEEAAKIRQQILSGNSSYANKGVLRFKASNGEVWYYDTKRKTYVKYADKEAQAIIKDLDKGATENWGLFRTGLGTDYELLKNTNAQIIDPEVLGKVNKHYSAEYGNKVDKNAQYGSGKYKTAYEAFLASEIGDDEVYQFNATLVKNNAITDQSRRNEILLTNLTKIKSNGLGVSGRTNRLAAADAASTKEDYQALQDAAEEELKKTNYKAPFKGSDALQTYIYGVNNGDVQEIDDFNTTLIDPKEDMIDRDEIVKIKAETGALWAKKGKYDKAFEAQDGEVVDKMFALQDANGKASLKVKELKAKAKGFQGEYLMFAKPELFTEQELADKAVSMLTVALDQFDFIEKQNSLQSESVLHNLSHSRSDVVASAMSDNGTKNASKNAIEASISKAYTLIRNDKVLNLVKQKMGDKFNLLQKKEQAMFKTNTFANVTTKNDNVKSNLSAEQVAQNKYVVSWLKSQLEDLERDKKLNEQKEGWKQIAVDAMRTSLRAGETRESLANKYDLIKSNMSRLEAAAEGKLVDKNGKPVSFEDAMKGLGETGIKALEKANQDYQSAQATGEFVVDMAVLALPLPKGFNAANTVIKMGNAFYKVISKSDKVCKVIKVAQEAIKGSKIYEVATKVATTNPKLVERAKKVATIMDSSATGAMHMAGKTFALEASNIATSREGFTADRVSEMNEKTKGAALFGGMGGAIGGTTGAVAEFVSSKGAKYAVHTLGLVADVAGAAGLITAESHGETNFWDNLRCVNPDGSFNFEQASMTAMMIFGHLHGMSSVKGKAKPQVELQADGTVKYTLNNNELKLNKDGIYTDSETGRKFRLATNKNSKTELTELTKKEIYNSRQKTEVKDGMTLEDFRQELKNNDLRGDVYTKADGGKLVTVKHSRNKYELFEFDNNNNMISKKSVVGKSAINESYPEFANLEAKTMGSTSGYLGMNKTGITGNKPTNVKKVQDKVNKKELTALRNELGIYQTQKGSRFEYVPWADGSSGFIHEKRGNDTVTSYYVVRNAEGKAYIQQKFLLEKGKAIDAESYKADGSVIEDKRVKQLVLENTNKIIQQEILDKIQKEMTLDECKKLSKQYDNIELNELNNGAYEVKFDFATWGKDMGGPEKSFYERLDAMASLDKEIEVVTAVHNKTGQVIKLTIKYQLGNSRDIEYNNAGKKTKETVKDAEGKITGVFDGDGKPLEIPNEVKEEVKQTGSEVSAEESHVAPKTEQESVIASESKSETKAQETDSARHSKLDSESKQPVADEPVVAKEAQVKTDGKTEQTPVNASESEAIQPQNTAETKTEPKTGDRFEVSIDDIPTTLSDMQKVLEKSHENVTRIEKDKKTVIYSIKNDETGGVMHVQFTDGKRSSMTFVEANDLQTHIEFAADGKNPSKIRTDFIDNNEIFTRVEDMTTGQIAFEKPVVLNGKRQPIGLIIENNTPVVKRFNEGTVENGKFTPKEEVAENAGESNTPKLTMTIEEAKELAKFENVEVKEQGKDNFDIEIKFTDENNQISQISKLEYKNGKLTKEIIKNEEGTTENVYKNGELVETINRDATGTIENVYRDGELAEITEYEYQNGKVVKSIKEQLKNDEVVSSTESEYNDGNVVKSTKSEYEKGELVGITESEYKDGNLTKETWVSADGNKTKITKNEYKDGTLIKSREELKTNNITEITEKEYKDGNVVKDRITNENGINEGEYNKDKLIKETIKDVNGNIIEIRKFEYKDQNFRPTKQTQTQYKDGKVVKITEYEFDDGYKLIKTTQKDADGNITQVTEKEYNNINGGITKETKTQFKDGKPTEITETEYEDLKPTKEINKDADGKVTKIYDHKLQRDLTPEEIKEYLSNKDNNIQTPDGNPAVENNGDVSPADQSTTGKTADEAAQNYKEEMNNVEPTSTAQVKNLEKYDIMFQSKEGKALLDNAKKDPNFGKTAEERVPSDKIVKDADGNIQSIEIDGITYTRNEQGKYVNGDSEIKIYEPNEAKRYDGSIIDKEITIDKENNKIQKIKSDDMTIEYDSNGQPERVFVLGGKSIDLYTGAYYQDYGNTYVDPAGKVIENDVSIDIEGRRYNPYFSEGYRYSDWGKNAKGETIESTLQIETENSLSNQIKDAQLENRGLRTTKKGRQKAYDDVRNQIEDAYNNSKIDRETADNLHAELNKKAEANGLETQETPTMKAEREALAKWNEQVDALKDNLMSDIKEVDSQATHDQMVEKIGDACKNGEIDMKRANELYDALEAKANSIDGVESLAQKAERINNELKAHENKSADEVAETNNNEEQPVTPEFEEVETNEGLQLRHKVGDENSYEFFNPETLKWEPTTKQFFDERVARDGVKAKPVEKTTDQSATGNTTDEASNIHNEAESGAITGDGTPVTTEESASAGESTPVGENSETANVSRGEGRFRIKLPERNKVPKNLRDENGKLRKGVTQNDKGYIESITKDEVTTTKNYDSKGTLVSETTENLTTYYNKNGKVIYTEEKLPGDKGVKITEKTKDYDLEIIEKDGSLKIIHHTKNENGTAKGTEEFKYSEKNKVYENTSSEGTVLKSVKYDADKHSWTIRDGEGKKLDSQNNMKESHIKRNIGIGAGALAVGLSAYGISKLVKSDDDKDVEQPANPSIAEQVAKEIAKQAANAKAETKVTLDGKEGTIAEDGTLTLDGKKYPKDTDGTYTIGDKKYKVEDGKLVEVVDTPDDNGETGGADGTDGTAEVKGTVDGKEYTIHSDGSATIGGHQYDKLEDGYYHTEDGSIYGVGEDGKLVKIDKTQAGSDGSQAGSAGNATQTGSDGSQAGSAGSATQTGSDSAQSGSAGNATQTGSDSAQAGSAGATSQQTGNTNTTGNNTHVTAPAQPADSSASTRTTGTTHNDTSVTTRHTNVPAEESRANSSRSSERSEESRRTGNTPVTGVTEPTEDQKQVANALQNEISNISTQADAQAFFTKLTSAVKNGQITIMQSDELLNLVKAHVETLVEADRAQDEISSETQPAQQQDGVTTPAEPKRNKKREITPMERMELTEKIRKAKTRDDIANIQQEMRQYKVFQGRKNLRRAYKAKLRAIKHQGESNAQKYDDKFNKRMEKVSDDNIKFNNAEFMKQASIDEKLRRKYRDFEA